ncbi:unnamed protein product, partial [Adineta steineri]
PSNNENNNNNAPATNQNLLPPELQITITDNPLVTTTITAPDGSSHSSIQSAGLGNNDDDDSNKTNRRDTATSQLISNLIVPSPRNTHSLLAKLTDAKKTLFGRATTPDPAFSSAEANKALLSYILSEPFPQLDVIQGHEREGAQLNAVTEEGNTAIHLLARAEQHSQESLNIVEYFIKKGCD